MTAFTPAYRLSVFSPRSVNADESVVLTPAANAPHADPFQIASVQGVPGFKPYLGEVKGRKGAIDHLTKKTTTGALTLKCFDIRTGTTNLQRWVTGFFGDASGKMQLVGCKIFIEENLHYDPLTPTVGWAPYFTGRIYDLSPDGPLWIVLQVRDFADDLKRQLFSGDPDVSVVAPPNAYVLSTTANGYAAYPTLVPMGVITSPLQKTYPLTAKAVFGAALNRTDVSKRIVSYGTITFTGDDPGVTMLCDIAHTLMVKRVPLRVLVTLPGGQQTVLRYIPAGPEDVKPYQWGDKHHYRLAQMTTVETIPGHPNYVPWPAPGTVADVVVTIESPGASADLPLHISDVHPVKFFADILDGKFSMMPGSPTLVPLAQRDTSGADTGNWNLLGGDASFQKARFVIDAPTSANDFVEKQLCQVFQLAYHFDELGRVALVDLRRSPNIVPQGTFVDDDLDTTASPGWSVSRDSAITGVEVTYYVEALRTPFNLPNDPTDYPPWPLALSDPRADTVFIPNDLSTLRDVGEKIQKIDAKGIRVWASNGFDAARDYGSSGDPDTTYGGPVPLRDSEVATAKILKLYEGFFAPYVTGATKYKLTCRRTTLPSAAKVGTWYAHAISKIPDPASNARGGTRLILCLSRSENGATIDLEFLDAGASAVAVTPVLGTATVSGDVTYIDLPVTLNASQDLVVLEYAVSPAGTATRPDERSGNWMRRGDPANGSGTLTVGPFPKGSRVWIRGRSQPTGAVLKLPSVWAHPSGNSFVDIAGITPPSGVTSSGLFANRVDISWTNGDATQPVELYLIAAGSAPSTWTEAMKVAVMRAGTTTRRLTDLATSTQYTVGVLHRDANGGPSTAATLTFTTTGAPGVAPRPAAVGISLKPTAAQSTSLALGSPAQTDRTGVPLDLWASDSAYRFEVQRAPDSAGAPNVGAAVSIATNVSSLALVYIDPLPLDAAVRWYRVRHVGFGDTPSGYTDWVSSIPVQIPTTYSRGPATAATIKALPSQTATVGTLTITIVDPQVRVTLVEERHIIAGAAVTSFATLTGTAGVYSTTVALSPGVYSSIEYRVTGYDADGVSRVLQNETMPYTTVGVLSISADVIATSATVIDVQLTAVDPFGGTPTISVASPGSPALTVTSLGSNQFRITRAAAVSGYSGRVIFQAVLAGRTTATTGVTVPPAALEGVTKSLILSSAAFTPSAGGAYTSDQDQLSSGAGAGVSQTFIAFAPFPQGVTITLLTMQSQCGTPTAGGVANVLKLYRQPHGSIGASVLIATATRASVSPVDAGGSNASSAVSEAVTSYGYCLLLTMSGDAAHHFFNAKIDYTMPTADKGL